MNGPRLTTHVLDIAQGRPAANLQIELWRISPTAERTFLKTVTTNSDGRVDEPLLAGEDFTTGTYELIFYVGEYFAARGLPTPDPPFLDCVPVRFAVADPEGHYHVPLLVSPWSYTTYRGS
jgi:5-hydroxyisourate hydrolase